MPAAFNSLDSGHGVSDDEFRKEDRLAARAARFTQKLPGNRYKELEEARIKERKGFEQQGLIKVGKTELGDAVDMRGTCERMCSDYEREFREWTREVHPFERVAGQAGRIDPNKAVAAYSRSDAGAGHGDSAILPSDLRKPASLVRTLDYLFSEILSTPPPGSPNPTARKALGYSAGFIRDRTRAIRKEFAMQSSWGHAEAISSFERIARWHILCLRELQEETGSNADMHIDSAELGRCFTSLRQHYNDRREELGVDQPCPNEPEFRAYMLIFDLAQKSVSIPTAELPASIIDHPLLKLAWEIRRAAQRNFDSQKEGSKLNAELGLNAITRFVKLLKQARVPFLLSCLVEIRLREMRRSALRALVKTYPRLRDGQPVRTNDVGEVVERRMVLVKTLSKILGCEEQEDEESAWDDVIAVSRTADDEAVAIAKRFELEVYEDDTGPVGAVINNGVWFNDNKDAPYTRRWKAITAKRGDVPYADIVNGKAGIHIDGTAPAPAPTMQAAPIKSAPPSTAFSMLKPTAPAFALSPSKSAFAFGFGKPPPTSPAAPISIPPAPAPAPAPTPTSAPPAFAFPTAEAGPIKKRRSSPERGHTTVSAPAPVPTAPVSKPFTFAPPPPPEVKTPPVAAPPPPSFFSHLPKTPAPAPLAEAASTTPKAPPPLFSKPSIFSTPAEAGPSTPTLPGPSVVGTGATAVVPAVVATPPTPGRLHKQSLALSRSARRTSTSLEEQRRRHRAAVPALADELVSQVIQDLIQDMKPELAKYIQRESAARAHIARKRRRQEDIHEWSAWILDEMIDDIVSTLASRVLKEEQKRRSRLERDEELRERADRADRNKVQAAKERQDMLDRLRLMGLGGSVAVRESVGSSSPAPRSVYSEDRLDEFETDVALLQAQRSKDHFFAPGTLLQVLARHFAPLLEYPLPSEDTDSPESPEFRVLLSIAQRSGSPVPSDAERWLVSKFVPPGGDEEEDQGLEYEGVVFDTEVVDRGGGSGDTETGLLVFEAPPPTSDHRAMTKNVHDAKARMDSLVQLAGRSSLRYEPALLILTWGEETLEQVTDRLGITELVDAFERVGVLQITDSEDLDLSLAAVLQRTVPDVLVRTQVTIHLNDLLRRLQPELLRLLGTTDVLVKQRPTDGDLASESFAAGIRAINEVPKLAQALLGDTILSSDLVFEPIILPNFEPAHGETLTDIAQGVLRYLEEKDVFAGLDEVHLAASLLLPAAQNMKPLPLIPLLMTLALFVLGDMSEQTLPLRIYTTEDAAAEYEANYLSAALKSYAGTIDEHISRITGLASAAPPIDIPPTIDVPSTPNRSPYPSVVDGHGALSGRMDDSPSIPPYRDLPSRQSQSRTLKRSRSGETFQSEFSADENSPRSSKMRGHGLGGKSSGSSGPTGNVNKAAKNARLLKALQDVEWTMREIGSDYGSADGDGMDVDEVEDVVV